LKLGVRVSEATVSKYMVRPRAAAGAVARVSDELLQGSDRVGFLHGANRDLSRPVRVRGAEPRPATAGAFQRYGASDRGMDSATTHRRVHAASVRRWLDASSGRDIYGPGSAVSDRRSGRLPRGISGFDLAIVDSLRGGFLFNAGTDRSSRRSHVRWITHEGRHHEARIARAEGSTTTPSDSYRTRTVENLEARAYVSWTNPRIITRTQRRNETCGETLAIGERAGRR
jgi:hypothetical protein